MTPTPDESFADRLGSLVAREVNVAKNDPDHMAVVIERLAAALGFTAALAAKGDPKTIDTLLAGAEAYAHAEAVDKAPVAALMDLMKQGRRP